MFLERDDFREEGSLNVVGMKEGVKEWVPTAVVHGSFQSRETRDWALVTPHVSLATQLFLLLLKQGDPCSSGLCTSRFVCL